MRVFAATPTQLSSPARASISLSATGVHAIQPLDAQRKKEAQKFQNWLAREVIPEYLAEISANHI